LQKSIAVPVVAEPIGATLEEAETTDVAAIDLNVASDLYYLHLQQEV